MSKQRLIAFYLPQFYPTKENNEWWSNGFTEWTNVGRAKPLFLGHYQPRVPADLGYYDLRVPETREQQANMAKDAGIEGFCYWHYWFAGRRLLDRVFSEVVESGKPCFPFCLGWANHSWYAKTWDPNKKAKLLIEQTYPGEQDFIDHFYAMLPAFKDSRYMKVNGKLIFAIFQPLSIPDFCLFKRIWNELALLNGLKGFYFVGYAYKSVNIFEILQMGLDAITFDSYFSTYEDINPIYSFVARACRKIFHFPYLINYSQYVKSFIQHSKANSQQHPCLLPNFDHSPRSAYRGFILKNSTPQKWRLLCEYAKSISINRSAEENLIFIKSWNEWGEGNYLEPDMKYGKQYLEVLKNVFDER